MTHFKFPNPLVNFMDWYIKKYHSDNYVHVSNIADAIEQRIESAIDRVNKLHDQDVKEKLKAAGREKQIEIEGYIAEIRSLERIVADAKRMRSEVEELYFKVKEYGKQLLFQSAESKQERLEICEVLSSTVGKLDKLNINAERINKEIEDNREHDETVLRLK